MQPHEPISVFRKPAPDRPVKRPRLSAARRLKFSCALAVLSTATLVILIAAEAASV